VAFQWNSLLI